MCMRVSLYKLWHPHKATPSVFFSIQHFYRNREIFLAAYSVSLIIIAILTNTYAIYKIQIIYKNKNKTEITKNL